MKKRFVNLLAFILIFTLMFVCNIVVFADTENNTPIPTTATTTAFEDTMIGKTYIVNTGNHKNLTVKMHDLIHDGRELRRTKDCVFDENNICEVDINYEVDFNIYIGSKLLFTSSFNAIKNKYISTKTFTVFNTLEEALNDKELSQPTEPEPGESESNQPSVTNPSDSESTTAGTINFREYTCIYPGDADGNCKIDVNDVTNIQKYLVKSITDEEMCLTCADINGDGEIDINDATETQRKIVGLDYNCFVYPDEDYLHTDECIKPESFSDEHKIDFERIYTSKDYISGIPFRKNSGVSLITNPGEFMSLMGYYYECFNDEYFEEKALIIAFGQAYDDQIEFSVNTVGIVDNGLYVGVISKFMGDDPTMGIPSAPKWIMVYSVNKKDIENVNSIY